MFETILPGLASAHHVHPVFVHFPIAFWLAAFGFYCLGMVSRSDKLWRFGLWLLCLGILGAAAALGTGFWAAEQLGHDSPGHEFVHVHRNYMVIATGLAVITGLFGFVWRSYKPRSPQGIMLLLLTLGTASATVLGADRGSELVFRFGVGTQSTTAREANGYHDHDHTDAAEMSNHRADHQPPSATNTTAAADSVSEPPDDRPRPTTPTTGDPHDAHEHHHED